MKRISIALAALALIGPGLVTEAFGISVSPNKVNVRRTGPTTVFLTFRGLATGELKPVDAMFCGELRSADNSCEPGTIFGHSPARNQIARMSGADNFTDIVTFPSSIVRRAYQRATARGPSFFFYVRVFRVSDPNIITPRFVFVPVLVRLTSGGAGAPLSLVEVRLQFKRETTLLAIPRGAPLPPFGAHIRYDGTGRLRGQWEMVLPGDPRPTMRDLLPEANLPLEERIRQRRYVRIGRFDRILPPNGKIFLPGPDPDKIRIHSDGLHLILLRIEASQDKVGGSNVGRDVDPRDEDPRGVIRTGGVAGFPMPVLRFYVGSGANPELMAELTAGTLQLLLPRNHAKLASGDPLMFTWAVIDAALAYKLEVERKREGENVLTAMLGPPVSTYTAPPTLREHAGEGLRWRVLAIGPQGIPIAASDWRDLRLKQ